MGSIAPADYYSVASREYGGNEVRVKAETNSYDDSLPPTSGEEDAATYDASVAQHSYLGHSFDHGGVGSHSLSDPAGDNMAADLFDGNDQATPTTANKDAPVISKRTLQNRKAQREFRQRRATYLKDLEAKVRRYESEGALDRVDWQTKYNLLVQENQYLRSIVDSLQQEVVELRKRDTPNMLASSSQPSRFGPHPHGIPQIAPPAHSPGARSVMSYPHNPLVPSDPYTMPYPAPFPQTTQQRMNANAYQHPSDPASRGGVLIDGPSGAHARPNEMYQQNAAPLDWSTYSRQTSTDDRPRSAPQDSPTAERREEHWSDAASNSAPAGMASLAPATMYPPQTQQQQQPPFPQPHPQHRSSDPQVGLPPADGPAFYGQYPGRSNSALPQGRTPAPLAMAGPQSTFLWDSSLHNMHYSSPTTYTGPQSGALMGPDQADYRVNMPVQQHQQQHQPHLMHQHQHEPSSRSVSQSPSAAQQPL